MEREQLKELVREVLAEETLCYSLDDKHPNIVYIPVQGEITKEHGMQIIEQFRTNLQAKHGDKYEVTLIFKPV
jgi:hypothetical protein